MPQPDFLNFSSDQATQGDQVDPTRRTLKLAQRVRAMQGDLIDGSPLALIPAELDLTTDPTTADTITIDGEVYEFRTAAEAVTNDAYIAVERGGGAQASLDNLIAAINGTAAAAHPNITDVATTGAALGRGTKPVFAVDLGSQILGLYYVGVQGRDPDTMSQDEYADFPTAYPSFVLADGLTAAVNWTFTNFNLMPVANPSQEVNGMVALRLAVVTALLDVPFRIKFAGGTNLLGCVVSPKSATGVPVYWDAATFNVSGGELLVDLDTGGTVDPANGQFVDIILFGQFAGIQA